MNVEPLRELGLTEGEIKVYLALIKLGETTTGPIVEEAGVSISKVYTILDKLSKKGLASHIIKKDTKYFEAADPNRLIDYLNQKKENLESQEKNLRSIIEELKPKKNTALTQETARIFEGLKGIQTARERTLNIMKKGDEIWIMGIAKSPYDKLTPYFEEYHKRRYKKGIKCHYLYNEDARKPYGEKSASYPLSEVKYMPQNLITHAWMEIYADTVTIGNNHEKAFSIIIQNQEVADSFRIYAQLLWKMAKT